MKTRLTLPRVFGLVNLLEGLQKDFEVRRGLAMKADMAACHIQVASEGNLHARATYLSIGRSVGTTICKSLQIEPDDIWSAHATGAALTQLFPAIRQQVCPQNNTAHLVLLALAHPSPVIQRSLTLSSCQSQACN